MDKIFGKHMLLDLTVDMEHLYILYSVEELKELLVNAALAANATVLNNNWHEFGKGFGVTGVVLLSESHISVHTWPEDCFLSIDIFMCGECDPDISKEYILDKLKPKSYYTRLIKRGIYNE